MILQAKGDRYDWSAHGAPWAVITIIDWHAVGGPRIVACVTCVEAAEAAVRLLSIPTEEQR